MAGNTFGKIFSVTSFGESHGKAIGGVIEGVPAGLRVDTSFIQNELNRRRPGQSKWVSPRQEADRFEILSGVFNNQTLGTPIGFLIWNKDQHSADYDQIQEAYRPSHADYTYDQKYGLRDHRGGGRSSARETISRVVAGAFAKLFLKEIGVEIHAYVKQLHHIRLEKELSLEDLRRTDESPLRCPDEETTQKMIELIESTAREGDTLGGVISCVVLGMPKGLGAPVFDKLHADLGKAMLSINAVKGFEYGSGFSAVGMKGSEHNDLFTIEKGQLTTATNFSGGVQGGISNGSDVYFNVAFKPIATVMKDQETVDKDGNEVTLKGKGRHDVTVLPRAVPIVEAMAALVLADHYLLNKVSSMKNLTE